MAAFTACGGGGSGAVAPVSTPVSPPASATYTVGGTVTGLSGAGLVLEVFYTNNLRPTPSSFVDDLPVSATGTFTFGRPVAGDTTYSVNVEVQPRSSPAQYCSLANSSGKVAAANVTNVSVTCGAGYSVGGTVSGLVGSGLVLQIENTQIPNDRSDPDHIGSPLPVKTNGSFTLDSVYPAIYPGMSGGGDFVKVTEQPSSPTQRCLIENAGISIQGANDTRVAVYCSEFAYVANAVDSTLSAYLVDAISGALLSVGAPSATGKSPSAVVGTYDRKFMYVANEGSNDISAFAVDVETGALTAVTGSPFASSTGPRALTLIGDSFLYVANTGSNTISAFAINATTGALTPLSPATYATGQGPSSLTVDPTDSFLYVANDGGSNDISAFALDGADGGLTPVAGSPFAAGGSPLSLAFGASGKFLYSANAGAMNSSVSGFSVGADGSLTALNGSPFTLAMSNSIATDPTGSYLYGTTGTAIVGYSIDVTTGSLKSLPGFPVVSGANSRSVALDPASQFLYVANNGSGNVSGFRFDPTTGGLTPLVGSPFAAGNSPDSLAIL